MKNKEKAKETNRKWRAANRESLAERNRKWLAANREQRREYMRKYQAANLERRRATARKRYEANPKLDAEKSRRWQLSSKFGLTKEGYDAMLTAQGGVCAICKQKPEKRDLAVDHDHATGYVRGLLCTRCNTTVGKHFDSPEKLRAVLRYVEKHSQLRLVTKEAHHGENNSVSIKEKATISY